MHLGPRYVVGPLFLFFSSTVGTLACESTSTSGSAPDAGGTVDIPSTCEPPSGPGTTHASAITDDETWTAAASPHVLDASTTIPAGRTITLEPCAVVRIAAGAGILVQGSLVANGAAGKPVTIERAGSAAWTSIETRKGAELRLSYTTVEGGGGSGGGRPTQFGMIDVRGDQESAPQPIFFADHVTVKGSESLGIWMREGGAFADGSQELTVTGGATFPMLVWGNAAGTIPSGRYTGNAIDEIFLPANGGRDDIVADTTFESRGVPYRIGGETGGTMLKVGAKGVVPLLTIAPGVTLRFAKQARLLVAQETDQAIGALRAEGTADAPIVFTSAEATPAPGDWVGVLFGGAPDPRDAIANARIEYAGGASQVSSYGCPSPLGSDFGNEGAVVIFGGKPSKAFVTSTRIEHSAADGIVRGWTGAEVDFAASNTFTDVARCNQTFPKPDAGGQCPTTCPK